MKIQKIEIVNFMGLKGLHEYDLPQIAAIIGPNGMGKTTLMNAIRFGLTGAEPDGEIISNGMPVCSVSVTMIDPADGVEYTFTRIKEVEKPSKCKINDKVTTKKSMDEKIEQVIGIPLDKVKILSSSDVVASMKPQEFSSFILDYIPEKLDLEKVISYVPDTTLGMIEIMEATLPAENIELSTLDEFETLCRNERKEIKAALDGKKKVVTSFPETAPEESTEEIQKQIQVLLDKEGVVKVYAAKKEAYDKAKAAAKAHREKVEKVRAEADALKADRPDPAIMDGLKKEYNSVQETLRNNQIALSSATNAVNQLEVALKNLESPVCPLSDKIKCCQDKTAAKEDLVESIESSKEGIKAIEEEITKSSEKIAEIEKKMDEYRKAASLYEKKISLLREIKALEEATPEIPAEPEMVETSEDFSEELDALQKKLTTISMFKEGETIRRQIGVLETKYSDYNALVKAFQEKGPVRTQIIEAYLKVFEDLCNERSTKVRPEITFKFESKDGVVVLMDNGKGDMLPYASLSGGERAYMIFILMDMLNALSGTNLLLMDELSVIDEKCFNALLDLVVTYGSDYDHIILASVNHTDIVDAITSHGIPQLDITSAA